MRRMLTTLTVAGVLCAGAAYADVRSDEKTQMKFEGQLGRMLNLFGGRAMRDGVTSTVAVKGDRKATINGDHAQIIDLKEEKIYEIDLKDKSYRVMTFAEMKRQMEEARQKAAAQAPREKPAPAANDKAQEPQVEIEFSLKESGQARAVNGFDAHEVIMTIITHEKGKKLEDSGGMVLTSNMWLAPKIAGMQEVAEFDRKYAQKMFGATLIDAQQIATAMAMYPMMKDAMAKMQAEKVNMNGTAVLTITKFEAVGNKEQADSKAQPQQQQPREEPRPAGLGGLIGGRIAKGIANRNKDKDADKKEGDAAAAPTDPNRATVMTIQNEILKVTPSVADSDVAVPAGFKLKT